MREILFRGKRVDNGEWITGYYIKANHHWHSQGIHEDWIVVDTIQNGGWCNVRGKYAVIPETIEQYTGLTDKNNKKIFEGDILEIHQSKVGKYKALICWGNQWEKSAFILSYRADAWDYMTVLNDPFKHIKSYTVIGNIHDNPELLND